MNFENLTTKRFVPNEESLKMMRLIKSTLLEMKEKIPEVEGAIFFGSRIIDTDKEGSDLDIAICVNGEKFWEDEVFPTINLITGEFEMKPTGKRTKDIWHNSLSSEIQRLLINKDNRVSVTNVIDTSKEGTEIALSKFIEFNNIHEERYDTKKGIPLEIQNLVMRFCLGTGNGLYKSRKLILDSLLKLPEGEKIWNNIVGYLSDIERTNKNRELYNNYPQTVSDAINYFNTTEIT